MQPQPLITKFLFFTLLTLALVTLMPLTGQAEVRARLDRQSISLDETVNLIIEADGALNTIASIDTSALEKDFSVSNSSTSSNIQIINGSSKATKTWTIELEPKKTGNFTIPPFTIGGEKTAALSLAVTPPAPPMPMTGSAGTLPDVFIEVTPEMDTPAYIQGQITISVKLFIKGQLRLTEASLEEPALEHANIIKLGDDRRYQSRKNNTGYQVIERKYAIIAEEGSELTIPPLLFQAISLDNSSRRFPADPFFDRFSGRGQRLRARSQELKIALMPIPGEFKGKIWLPARDVKITEKLEGENELKVGEPLTRTIEITATGVTAEQLPAIKTQAPDGAKIYLDQAEHQTENDGNLLHAVKRQAMAFIPSREGLFTLPAVTIDWWDVINNKPRQAVLPARRIRVTRANDSAAAPPLPSPKGAAGSPAVTTPDKTAPTPNISGEESTPSTTTLSGDLRIWQALCGLLLGAWLITLLAWRLSLRRRLVKEPTLRKNEAGNQVPATREMIKKACLDNNPRATQQALLNWAAANWPQNPPTNLRNLTLRLDHLNSNPDINKVLTNLEETLYSPEGTAEEKNWNGAYCWQKISPVLQPEKAGKPSRRPRKELPPLYPPDS
ncbi:MAG: protein BatD [Deltaproteobacteria bacterium]|nr:protein BatD [Deltaproteobacteria bacterium]